MIPGFCPLAQPPPPRDGFRLIGLAIHANYHRTPRTSQGHIRSTAVLHEPDLAGSVSANHRQNSHIVPCTLTFIDCENIDAAMRCQVALHELLLIFVWRDDGNMFPSC